MGGSLYFSEVANYTPCPLCWYQRIAMYPLVVILGIAALRSDLAVRRYVLPLVAIGSVISIYHYQLERFPSQTSVACSADVPCTVVWIWRFHYISIPFMALSAFALIAALLLLGAAPEAGPEDETIPEEEIHA
jgi:disulfide bond formation protein DsbB